MKRVLYLISRGKRILCFIGPQNQRFRLKKRCLFSSKMHEKGVFFKLGYEHGIRFGRVGGPGCTFPVSLVNPHCATYVDKYYEIVGTAYLRRFAKKTAFVAMVMRTRWKQRQCLQTHAIMNTLKKRNTPIPQASFWIPFCTTKFMSRQWVLCVLSQRTHDVLITSLLRQNDVAMPLLHRVSAGISIVNGLGVKTWRLHGLWFYKLGPIRIDGFHVSLGCGLLNGYLSVQYFIIKPIMLKIMHIYYRS